MNAILQVQFDELLQELGFRDKTLVRGWNPQELKAGDKLSVNSYLYVDFEIDDKIAIDSKCTLAISLNQWFLDWKELPKPLGHNGKRIVEEFEVEVHVVESCGDWQEDMKIVYAYLGEVVLEIVEAFRVKYTHSFCFLS